jgi:osmotically-inducible protein OsmY
MRRMRLASLAAAAFLVVASAQAQMMYTSVLPSAAAVQMSDEDLQYTAAKAISEDDSLKGTRITVKVVDHRVVLEGITFSQEQAKQARAVVEFAVGPERVVTEIEVAR